MVNAHDGVGAELEDVRCKMECVVQVNQHLQVQLTGAVLTGAVLTGAVLTGAVLTGAVLTVVAQFWNGIVTEDRMMSITFSKADESEVRIMQACRRAGV